MQQRRIADLAVSVVGIGCNQFGPTADEATVSDIVARALDLGVNFFDVADEYGPDGRAEELLGRALRARRDEAVVATTFAYPMGGDPQRGGASARWIREAVEDSLQRLGTDHIDLYQQHFPDPTVPVEETLDALDELVHAGKIRHHGACNLRAPEIAQRCTIAIDHGFAPPVSVQDRYNLLRAEARTELFPTVREHGLAFLPYFPLASGMLSGKYRTGRPVPDDSRFARHLDPAQAAKIIGRNSVTVERLDAWARARDHTVAELAIAWLASQPEVTSVIAGVTRPEQVDANVAAGGWVLDTGEIADVAAVATAAQSAG
jgi:aryl-alcohol dehydrogenase-like predicted oxidoreductase